MILRNYVNPFGCYNDIKGPWGWASHPQAYHGTPERKGEMSPLPAEPQPRAEPVKSSVFVQMHGQMTSPLVRSVRRMRREARALLKGCLPPGIMRMGSHAPVATEA